MLKREPSLNSIGSDGNTSFLRAARAGHLDKVLEHLKSNIDINTSNANGLNALHLASKDGHVDVVAELLRRGAVVDAATKKGNTALHIASLAGQEEVVKLLVQHGASVNVQSQNGFTPLYMAAQENHDNVVKYLLSNGANQSLATEDGFTPLAVAMQQGHDKVVTVLLENDTRGKVRLPALHIAAKKDDVKAAKLLLENEHNPDVTSKSGFTPLHIASHYGNEAIANLLIHKGADVNYAAKHNITPLHVAAKWGKTNMVALLLEHGANIESKTRDGLTPLHCAARSGHEQVVDMLLERGAPISCKTKNGLAPLHMAAQGDHVDAARILLYHRAPVDEVTVDYLTALHVAAHCGHVRVAKLLLDRQADANARALNGFTPLHIACKKNRIKVVELLLKHGASIGATTESGLTPLHVASFMGCMNIVIYLLQHDANPDVPTVRGETPLHLAARANQTDIIRILLRNGAQVDARAREQQTPLHIASRLGNVDIVMLLLQHGAKVDTTTKDMYTALHIAAKEGQDEVAAVLIENGASLNATTKKGFTPLHLAAKYGNIKVAKLLLQKEAPVDAQGKNGVTPLHVASHYDHQNVALLLLDKGASPHATAKNGHTPLHIAARKNQMDIANTLLEYGAKPNAESKAGFTPLHLSAQEGHTDMSSLLIEHEANTNHPAKNGLTPMHLCAQEDRVPVAEILAKNGAQIDAATKGGFTPLHIASHYGQTNMVKFLLANGANVGATTSLFYTPLHQAAQQGHTNIVNLLLENSAQPNSVTMNGQTPLNIAQKLGYISVIETLKVVTETTTTTTTTTTIEEKYKVVAPEAMQETFMSDSEEEGGEDTVLGDHSYRYLTADEMKSLGDDSLPIDVTRDERIDSNKMVTSEEQNVLPPQAIEDNMSPQYITENYVEYTKKYTPDNVDIGRHPINIGKLHWKNFLVSFLVDARGGAMRGCRHSGVRVIVPPRCAPSPTRITCRYVRPQRTPHPPPLMEGEALASRVLELGPVGAKFLGPVIIEVPHFAALRGKEREIVILRSDNGETWREHTVEASEDILNEVLNDSFEAEDLSQLEDISSGRITRVVTHDFPQYFAIVTRIRQEVHAIGPEGGMVSSTVVPQVQAVFPQGALTKKIKVGLQAQPIDPELSAKLLGHGVAVSPVVTVEPRRRKFHKAITLSMPAPRAHSQGMINQYSGNAPTLRLLCSITGGTTRAQWEDVTGSTPLTFVNDCVSFTTTVSARFWLMDCRNIGDATKMATELYKEAIHVPFMAKFVVFAKRIDPLEARLRVFCMTDDKEDKTLEHQEHFTEVAKSRDVEVLEGKPQFIEFAGNLVPITKSGEPLQFSFRAFRENRLPFSVRVKDQHAEAVGRCLFMREPKVAKGEPPQQPICILNIVLPDDIVTETVTLADSDTLKRHVFLKDNFEYYRPDPRLADMSNLLGEDWVPLATQLGLTPSEINVIKSEYPDSVAKQAQSMLRMWISQSGNKAQGDALESALMRIGREDIIPQCLNVEDEDRIPRIPKETRYHKDIDTSLETLPPRQKETYESKYSAEEKEVEEVSDDEEDFLKSVSERRQQIEKRLTDRKIPASAQRQEIAEEITSIKRQSMVEDKIAEVEVKQKPEPIKTTTIIKTVTTDVPETKKTVAETVETTKTTITTDYPPSEVTVTKQFMEEEKPDRKTTVRTIITETRTTEHIPTNEIPIPGTDRRDSDLLEGVTQRLETTKKRVMRTPTIDGDPNSPKLSKTPPPSPADFIFKEQAAVIQEWSAPDGQSKDKPAAAVAKQGAAMQETSSVPLIKTTELTSEPKLTPAIVPKPKPRVTKSPDTHLQLTTNIEKTEPLSIKSPVRDDTLDTDESESLTDTYSDKKKFWENVTKDSKVDPKIKKRYSLYEDTPTEKITLTKRTSIHEVSVEPPVPKPRVGLQSSQSIAETKEEVPMTFDEKIEAEFAKPLSEYQSAFVDHSAKIATKSKEETTASLEKSDSSESEQDQSKSTGYENTGYISDSGDVEHYISDSEIEDRVPQIRERQMSVFQPATTARKSIYERSMSLPTEDLYDLKNALQRKQCYEQQMKREMIGQELSEYDEEPSPEKKALDILPIEEEEPVDAKSLQKKETPEATTVKDIAKSFGPTVKTTKTDVPTKVTETPKPTVEDKPDKEERKSVKDIAKSFEAETFIMGQKIMPAKHIKTEEKKGEIIEKDKVEAMREAKELAQKPSIEHKPTERVDLMKYMEESVDESTTDVTMQDFETSEELGSKETDEISTRKHVVLDSASYDLRKDEITDTLTTDSMLLVSEKDLRTPDLRESGKTEYKDTSEADEKSEESKLTYASDIDRDSLVTKDIIDMLKQEDHTETLSDEREPSLLEKHTQKDTEVDADLSEADQKSDASRITYASDIEKDVYRDYLTEEVVKEKEGTQQLVYDQYNGGIDDAVFPTETYADKVTQSQKDTPDKSKDLPREDILTHKPTFDTTTISAITAEIETHKLDTSTTHKVEDQVPSSQISEVPTHKEPDTGPRVQSSTESEQSVFSDHSLDLGNANYKEDLTSKPSDSMEVHVDKSEIEDSEKIADLDQDATDIETKSLDSLNATEISPKTSFYTEENIPEITISLSGKQRRISEESEDSEEKAVKKEAPKEVVRKSESGTPIHQPEEHVQDTIWEVPIQSQDQPVFEERTSDLPPAKGHAEKDDDLSSSLHDESDLGSEIHQDHSADLLSESAASDKIKSDSHSEIEKLILESLHQQKISHEDAKIIASELLQDIEAEIQKRQSATTEIGEPIIDEGPQIEVSEYLKQLAEAKGLDSREVQLVQSVLARKQRQIGKLSRGDTQASSMEITDEDLKYSGAEVDLSPSASRANILEEQIEHLEVERIVERKLSRELGLTFGEPPIFGKPGEKQYHDDKYGEHKTEIDTKVTEKVKSEKERTEETAKIKDTTEAQIHEMEKTQTTTETLVKELDEIKEDQFTSKKDATADIKEDEAVVSDIKITISETKTDAVVTEKARLDEKEEKERKTVGKYESEEKITLETETGETDQEIKSLQEYKEDTKEDVTATIDRIEETKVTDGIVSTVSETAMHKKISSSSVIVDTSHTESKTISSTVITDLSPEELESLKASLSPDELKDFMKSEISKTVPEETKQTSSDDSKSSQDELKSPDEQISTSSSGKRSIPDAKVEVVMRKPRGKDTDTSSSSPVFKPDRKSGMDFEAYSSSGESHYQSFELDSGRSRPCSSDVEGLIAAGSSEYESALTSQDISATTHLTSYHTAVSSLSSKESMKSLDSESSGNLASVEVSEASETLVASEYDAGDVTGKTLDDFSVDRMPKRQSTELSDSELIYPDMQESLDVSEEDGDVKVPDDLPSKMKRSYEMTFQPEPKILAPGSPHSEIVQEIDERFGTSLDEGSVLSVSLSSTSSATALRTVIEMSPVDPEKVESSAVVLPADYYSHSDMDSTECLIPTLEQSVTETSTSTLSQAHDTRIGSVTITTSTIAENGIQSVCTQVTSESHSPELDQLEELKIKEDTFDPKKRGHRRCESTVSSNIISDIVERKIHPDFAESDKYMSAKEGKSDEKKDVDETEKDDYLYTDADQIYQRDGRDGRYIDTDYDLDGKENDVFDFSRPQSQVSKSDSERERITSTAFSDDRPDSELAELAKQCSSSEAVSDPIERPVTPEPCEPGDEYEIKDDTPEFSSEAQASVGELEQEYSSAIARSQEISEIKKQILSEVASDKHVHKEIFDKRDSHGKLSSTSSEKSSFEDAEAEAVFGMVAHVSPAHKIKQICPILEDEDAEKHELETRERAQKEYERRRSQYRDQSPGAIPDIKVTQHMAPLVDRGFLYPDLELEKKDEEDQKSIAAAPASSKTSESVDPADVYTVEEPTVTAPEVPEVATASKEKEEKVLTETKSEVAGEKTEPEKEVASPTESPNSDSFEMLEKPDLIDDFVVIEEVGKEASEMDMEGKSVKISSRKYVRRHDQEVEEYLVKSAPSPSTKMTDIKYYPDGSSSEELGFDFEESPPQPSDKAATAPGKSPRDYVYEYDKELEANRKWIEQQFQGSQAAMIAAGYGYEMEFERGPLEDIKEEDINDFDSSRIGSLSSQKESGGSLGSVKDSYSSTPEYDVLAGRKYFTRSGEHDDVSMSSLQEFENLERAMSLEHRRCIAGSQDSSSNGSFKNRFYAGKSGQGDDVSVSSLKEFEGLEKACIAAHKIEVKVKEEEAMLSLIDEGQESIASESESCETVSGTDKKLIPDSDDEDYEKRMFEIDEIIKQAQSNVERFIEIEKTESLGRGDSFEEVAKVPDLDLDTPISRTATKVQWAQADDVMATSTDSLDLKPDKPSHHDSTDSLDQKTTAADIMTASTDSIEFQAQKCKDAVTSDSIEIRDGDRSYMITSDSLEMVTGSQANVVTCDSIDEDGSRIGGQDQSSSSTGKDFSSSVKEDAGDVGESRHPGEYMLGSTDSIASTSTATHATYQYETDSVYSGSHTSGGSNTMVSSTETIEASQYRDPTDAASEAFKGVWFDEDQYLREGMQPYVTEIIEPCDEEDGAYSHTVHRQIQLPPEVSKVTFTGPDAEEQMRKFMEKYDNVVEEHETEEIDEHGNKHIKRVVQKRFVIMDDKPEHWQSEQESCKTQITRTVTDEQASTRTTFTQQFDPRQMQRITRAEETTGEASGTVQRPDTQTASQSFTKAQGSRRRPLRYEISIDDQTEVDPREHDWRFNLPQHAETEESSGRRQPSSERERPIADQHMLSDEMKKLLKELEEESKK